MKKEKADLNKVFNITMPMAILVTTFTFLPIGHVVFWLIEYGEISENSMGHGGRLDISPEEYFLVMCIGSLVFFFVGFLPMCRSLKNGFLVKFDKKSIYYNKSIIKISEIDAIVYEHIPQNIYHFHMKDGAVLSIKTAWNKHIRSYINSRFYSLLRKP